MASKLREVILSLYSGETLPGVLQPALRYPVQDRHGPVTAGPEEGHKKAGAPLLRRQAETFGVIQPGEEKEPGRTYCGLSVLS